MRCLIFVLGGRGRRPSGTRGELRGHAHPTLKRGANEQCTYGASWLRRVKQSPCKSVWLLETGLVGPQGLKPVPFKSFGWSIQLEGTIHRGQRPAPEGHGTFAAIQGAKASCSLRKLVSAGVVLDSSRGFLRGRLGCMKLLVLGLAFCLPLGAVGQSFSVSFPKDVSAQALDGRLLLVLSTDASDEPRNQVDDTPRTQMVFGVTVDGWKPGEATVVDAGAWGYPVRSLKDVPAGDYYVQAVLNKYTTFHRGDGKTVKLHADQGEGQVWNRSPGNLYSKVR